MTTLSPSQQNVVDSFPAFLMSDDWSMTITGFAGSGKSYLVEYLAYIGEKQLQLIGTLDPALPDRKLFFTATTNKAAAVLHNMLGRPVSTIHSLLGLKVKNNYRTGLSKLEKTGKRVNLNHSLIFIDESSMINHELHVAIKDSVTSSEDCKVIFIGDKYQLPPVKENICPVFNESANTFFLKEIQRQVEDNPIIQLSSKYREVLEDISLDWPIIPHDGKNIIMHNDKHSFFDAIKNAYTAPMEPEEYKIIAWSNARVQEYNKWVRSICGWKDHFEVGEYVTTNKPLFAQDKQIRLPTDERAEIVGISPHEVDGIQGYWIELNRTEGVFFQPANWADAIKLSKKFATNKN